MYNHNIKYNKKSLNIIYITIVNITYYCKYNKQYLNEKKKYIF